MLGHGSVMKFMTKPGRPKQCAKFNQGNDFGDIDRLIAATSIRTAKKNAILEGWRFQSGFESKKNLGDCLGSGLPAKFKQEIEEMARRGTRYCVFRAPAGNPRLTSEGALLQSPSRPPPLAPHSASDPRVGCRWP
ncbi:hypothetical protein OAZ91_00895 [bacterium]|nr:hypothetical protein [bacterium]